MRVIWRQNLLWIPSETLAFVPEGTFVSVGEIQSVLIRMVTFVVLTLLNIVQLPQHVRNTVLILKWAKQIIIALYFIHLLTCACNVRQLGVQILF